MDAGVGVGMRVIDLGCGAGEVTLLIAKLVGDDGHVIGVDRQARATTRWGGAAERRSASHLRASLPRPAGSDLLQG